MPWSDVLFDLARPANMSVFNLARQPIASVLSLSTIIKRKFPAKTKKPKTPAGTTIRNPLAGGTTQEVHRGGLDILKTKAGFGTIKM